MKIGIVLGSVRDARVSPQVGEMVLQESQHYPEAEFTLIDLKEFDLPLMKKRHFEMDGSEEEFERVDALQKVVNSCDAFIFITQEYTRTIPASLKTIFEYFYFEYFYKVMGIVSYGNVEGARAAEHLRQIVAEYHMTDVRTHVTISLENEFTENNTFEPSESTIKLTNTLIGEIIEFTEALQPLREKHQNDHHENFES